MPKSVNNEDMGDPFAPLGIEKGELNSDSRRQAIAEARGFCEASGHTLSPTLAAQAAKGGAWPLRWVDLEVKDGAATITNVAMYYVD